MDQRSSTIGTSTPTDTCLCCRVSLVGVSCDPADVDVRRGKIISYGPRLSLARAAPGLRCVVYAVGECVDRGFWSRSKESHHHVFEPHHRFRRVLRLCFWSAGELIHGPRRCRRCRGGMPGRGCEADGSRPAISARNAAGRQGCRAT